MGLLRNRWAILFATLLVAGCELEKPNDTDDGDDKLPPGVVRIDATAADKWSLYDLDAGRIVGSAEGWDLGFRRQLIIVNGQGGALVAVLDGVNFDELTAAPEEGYITDEVDLAGNVEESRLAFNKNGLWYDYDFNTHTLSPKANRVYVVVSTEGRAFALRMIDYYDDAGTSGYPTFEVKEIDPPTKPQPEKPKTVVIDATDEAKWVLFDLDALKVVNESAGWELAFRRQLVVVNGKGGVEIAVLDGANFEEITAAPEEGYVTDEIELAAEVEENALAFNTNGLWYDYDFERHVLTPKADRVYVVVSTEGRAFALRMVDYYDSDGNSGYPTFEVKEIAPRPEKPWEPEIPEDAIVVDATSDTDWVFFDLDTLEVVEESAGWELAFRRHLVATNGAAGVRVAILDDLTIDEVEAAPEGGYLSDDGVDIHAEPLEEGDLAFHQQGAWYSYDLATHRLSVRKRVYVVVNADEKAFAVQMLSYYKDGESGHPTFVVKELGEPANSQVREVRIDATDGAKWILFDLDAGQVVDGSAGWDLAFQRQKIAVNGDVGVEVAWIDDVVLEEIESAPEDGYARDAKPITDETLQETDLAFHQDGGWYEYNPSTHRLTPRKRIYVVRSSEGKTFALQMIDYYDAASTSGYPTFRYKEIE